MGLPPFHATGRYLEELERYIDEIWHGQYIPMCETLPYGILLGDVLVQRFQAIWHYSPWTGVLDGDAIEQHHVELAGFRGQPMLRVAKFIADPTDRLVCYFDMFEALKLGKITFDNVVRGQWVDLNTETMFRLEEEKGG
jgi:hypothetical protein